MNSPPTLTMEHMALSWLSWDVLLPVFDWATEGAFGLRKCPGKWQAPLIWICNSDPTAMLSKSTWYLVERAQVTIEWQIWKCQWVSRVLWNAVSIFSKVQGRELMIFPPPVLLNCLWDWWFAPRSCCFFCCPPRWASRGPRQPGYSLLATKLFQECSALPLAPVTDSLCLPVPLFAWGLGCKGCFRRMDKAQKCFMHLFCWTGFQISGRAGGEGVRQIRINSCVDECCVNTRTASSLNSQHCWVYFKKNLKARKKTARISLSVIFLDLRYSFQRRLWQYKKKFFDFSSKVVTFVS